MNQELHSFVRQARENGADHQTIRDQLVGAGWHPDVVDSAVGPHSADHSFEQPSTPEPQAMYMEPSMPMTQSGKAQTPIPVVQNLTTRGAEYYLMLISLAISATALGGLLQSIVAELFKKGSTSSLSDTVLSFGGSALVVSLPIFIFLFLRLKKAELANPDLRIDPSRRRAFQIGLILSFLIGLFSLIGYVYTFFNAASSSYGPSINAGETIVSMLITMGIVGGVFAYFWFDAHTKGQS